MNRRKVLTRLLAATGSIGVAIAAVPFVRYFYPSARAKALGSAVSVDLSTLSTGEVKKVVWRGQTVFVMKRKTDQLARLSITDDRVLDDLDPSEIQPGYIDPQHRARNPNYLILIANCTHAGCIPLEDLKMGRSLLGNWWPGGFHCPCHHSIYDYAGRVVRGPAPRNLRVPPHYFVGDDLLIIGEDAAEA